MEGAKMPRPTQDAHRFAKVIATALLLLAPAPLLAAASNSEPTDWRSDPAFLEASAAIEAWLSNSADADLPVAAWRQAIETAPRASRLAEPLRQLTEEHGGRVATLLATPPASPPDWLKSIDGGAGPSLQLAIAETFASRGDYEACLAWTSGLDAEPTFSPALLAYLRAVAGQQTVDDEVTATALKRLDDLADDPIDSLGPARGWVLSTLRREHNDKPKPLPTVVRRMRDVERRLALSQNDEATKERQQTILDELDKLLEELEEQRKKQQQQQAAQAGGQGSGEPTQPAEESRPSDLKGPGEVDRRRLVAGDSWGALPPAERERLTQSITRDFPPHYRALVEDYFKTLAAEADATDPPASDR